MVLPLFSNPFLPASFFSCGRREARRKRELAVKVSRSEITPREVGLVAFPVPFKLSRNEAYDKLAFLAAIISATYFHIYLSDALFPSFCLIVINMKMIEYLTSFDVYIQNTSDLVVKVNWS